MSSVVLALVAALSSSARADETEQAIADTIARTMPHLTIVDVAPTTVDTLYRVQVDQQRTIFYVTGDRKHLIAGDLYRLDDNKLVNLTEIARMGWRRDVLSDAHLDDTVLYSASEEPVATLFAFMDLDCPHCQAFHADLPTILGRGIRVRYVAFPLDGIESPTYDRMVSAWCAEDPRKAITDLTRGTKIPSIVCDAPIIEHHRLGEQIGVVSTPTFVSADGHLIEGYKSPSDLAARLGLAEHEPSVEGDPEM